MIGRAAQGRPWIFREIAHFPRHRRASAAADGREARELDPAHLADHYAFYGEDAACAPRASTSAGTRSLMAERLFRARCARRQRRPPQFAVVPTIFDCARRAVRAPAVSRREVKPRAMR
jgi:tRNA-dihydrouridine synthase B